MESVNVSLEKFTMKKPKLVWKNAKPTKIKLEIWLHHINVSVPQDMFITIQQKDV